MLTATYSSLRANLKTYCDEVAQNDEAVLIKRRSGGDVVLVSFDEYIDNLKRENNKKFSEKLERARTQLASGGGSYHELIDDED